MFSRFPVTVITVLTVLAFLNVVSAYDITYIGLDTSGTTLTPFSPSVFWDQACISNLGLRYTAGSSGTFSLNNVYYSPNGVTIATSNPSFLNNVSCHLDSSPISGSTSLNGFYETTVNTTYSADTIDSWIETVYDCDFNSDEYFIYNGTHRVDSYGNHPFSYGDNFGTCCACSAECSNDLTGDLLDVVDYLERGYDTVCGNQLRVDAPGESFGCACAGTVNDMDMNYWLMTPFNSMASGNVNITIDQVSYDRSIESAGTFDDQHQYYLWDTVENGTIDLGTTFPYTGILSLTPERDYWLFTGSRFFMDESNWGSQTNTITYDHTNYSITIWAYEPAWDCTAWSDCVDTLESRVCTDPLGRVPRKIETRLCALGILENATLGFEDTVSVTATICVPQYNALEISYGFLTGITCSYDPFNITVERPLNWTVTGDSLFFNRYFMDFTNEWASEGSRSLKMWTIPPKEGEVDWSGTAIYCTNVTTSDFPIIEQNMSNNTMRANFNVTFPAENMRITFDAKRCENQVRQHYDYTILNNTFFEVELCRERCYANDCNTPPTGEFYFDLWDTVTQSSVFSTPQYVIIGGNRKQTIEYDLSALNVIPGRVYTLSFAVYNQDPIDTRGNCVLLDNMRYDVLETSFLSIMNGECRSQCVGNGFYEARQLPNGACVVQRVLFSDNCLTGTIGNAINNLESICLDSQTLLHYNPRLADHEEIICDLECITDHCATAEEVAEDVPDVVNATVREDDIASIIDELLGFMYTKFFWASLITILIILFGAGIGAKRGGKSAGILGAFVGIMSVIFFTVNLWFPFWVGIGIALSMSLLLVMFLKDQFLG